MLTEEEGYKDHVEESGSILAAFTCLAFASNQELVMLRGRRRAGRQRSLVLDLLIFHCDDPFARPRYVGRILLEYNMIQGRSFTCEDTSQDTLSHLILLVTRCPHMLDL